MHAERTASESAAEVITWQVNPGRRADFESWAHGITTAATTRQGHLGAAWFRPDGADTWYQTVIRFTTADLLARWMDSDERAEWITLLDGIATEHVSRSTGMESWFSLPDQAVAAPPKWKMAVVSFAAIWPLSILFNGLVVPAVVSWPLLLRASLFPLGLVPLLTFLIMPRLSRLLRHWLYSVD
jgi:antibiotic biosynthesis monooxygenase (ABM) superfamily enzyme